MGGTDSGADGLLVGEMRDAMRNWVTAGDEYRHDGRSEELIRMDIKHNLLEQRWHDLLFNKDSSIFSAKEKLHKHGAGSVSTMELYLRRGMDTIFLYDDSKTLREYGAENDMELFVKDLDEFSMARNGGLEDVSQVKKFELTEEEYDKKEKTLRAHFKKQKEMGVKFTKNANAGPCGLEGIKEERPETPRNVDEIYKVGARCECNPGGRRGTVQFVGKLGKKEGTWIGVALDEPSGINDGTYQDKKYFECKGPKYGCFSRHENCNVGDFPELDPFADLGLSDEDEI